MDASSSQQAREREKLGKIGNRRSVKMAKLMEIEQIDIEWGSLQM